MLINKKNMNKITLLSAAAILTIAATSFAVHAADIRIDNPEHAVTLLSDHSTAAIEGIWEYPADEVSLIVLADPLRKGTFGIYIVEAVDCRLTPGMQVGLITRTADPQRFRLSLCSRLKKGLAADPRDCAAKLSADGAYLTIDSPKIRIALSPSIIFPRLWNMLRMGMRIKTTDPADRLPDGWHKIHPATTPQTPITL